MLSLDENKDEVIRHLKYQIKKINEISNAPLYMHLKPYIEDYIRKIKVVIQLIENSPEEHINSFEFEDYGISYGYNNNSFVTKIKKCYAENNFTRNCFNVVQMHMKHKIKKYDFSEQDEEFIEKFYLYISDCNDFEKFNENLKSEENVDNKDLEVIEWVMSYFWDKVFSEEELIYIIKNIEDVEEDFLIGEEQIKEDNALSFYLSCNQDESFTSEEYKYALNLRMIAHMYGEDKDIAIDEKYMREMYHLVTKKHYGKGDILKLIKNSTVEERLKVHLILNMDRIEAKSKELEKNNIKRCIENKEELLFALECKITLNDCINAMSDALNMLENI